MDLPFVIKFYLDERRGVVSCTIQLDATGVSRQMPIDNWDQYEGMVRAFDRAVTQFPREMRSAMWKQFHAEFGFPKPRRKAA